MSDPVLTLILLAFFFAAMPAARFFKNVDGAFGRIARRPLTAGVIVGLLLLLATRLGVLQPIIAALLLTFTAVWVRHTGDESEATDGMIGGALAGAAAAIPLALFSGAHEIRLFSELVLSGSVAGYGITYAAFHVADRGRQLLFDAFTALLAIAAAFLPIIAAGFATDREVAIATAVLIPLITIGVAFRQWSDVRAELAHEAALGFMAEADVYTTAHPLRRLGRGGWIDRHAHREFVRLASLIALRKRQQRGRSGEMARLHQLEIIKLRMQLQEMNEIDRAARTRRNEPPAEESGSDKMRA